MKHQTKLISCVIIIAVTCTLLYQQICHYEYVKELLQLKEDLHKIDNNVNGLLYRSSHATKIIESSKTNMSPSTPRMTARDVLTKINNEKMIQENRELANIIGSYFIRQPSSLPYNLTHPGVENPSPGQTQFVDQYLKQMRNGFYIESGAFDGEHFSNSLFLERYRNWTGILIEPNPSPFETLTYKRRNCYTLNACLSTKQHSSIETFYADNHAVMAKVVNGGRNDQRHIQVQCFPLYAIMRAMGRIDVDYFSLDVEGAERGVLDTIPWDKLNIKLISIEHNKWVGGKQNLTQYMSDRGYKVLTQIKVNVAPDLIFVKIDEVL